jgi:sugar phosphate isomerase/epimerase
MHTTRRSFLKKAGLIGTAIIAGPAIPALGSSPAGFAPGIGVCTGFNNAGLLSGLGYSFIEEGVRGFLVPDKPEAEFLEKLEHARGAGLPVIACNSFLPGNMKSVGPDAVHDDILHFAETAFRRARMAGVKIIVFGSGGSRRLPENFSREKALSQFISLGKQMAPLAGEHGVTIVLEPLNRRECNFINSLEDGAEIVIAVDHENYMLLADIYHMKMDDEDPANIQRFGNLISHVHIAEKEGRAAPGTHGEDFSPWFRALARTGYEGCISVECRWDDMAAQAGPAFATITRQVTEI